MRAVESPKPSVQRQRGRWVVRVVGYDAATGRRKIRQLGTFDTKRAATACARSAMEDRAGGDDENLAAFLEQVWLPAKEGRVEVATYEQYRWAVGRHIVPLIGAVRLRDLKPEVVDDWVRDLIRISETGKRRLGATSSRLVRKVLSMALEEAVQRGRNPVALTQPPPVSRTHERLAWTLEEARAFLAGLGGHRLAAAFQLCLVTGLRRGEVLALRWDVVDLERRQLEVVQQLAVERGRPVLSNSRPRRARGS